MLVSRKTTKKLLNWALKNKQEPVQLKWREGIACIKAQKRENMLISGSGSGWWEGVAREAGKGG